jgi:hypothetical protein
VTLQRTHGRLYPLVAAPDELPAGLAATPEPVERRRDGRLASAEAARALGKRGGLARARRRADARAWGATVGLGRLLEMTTEERLSPFVGEAEAWLKAQCEACARDVGGGQLSPGVVSILRTAAWERLYSAFLFDCATRSSFAWDAERDAKGELRALGPRTDLVIVAGRLGDSSRQNLLAAHELAAREAQARPRGPVDPMAHIRAMAEGRR